MILLRSATRITHKALAVTCLAAKWHVCATIDSFDATETETPVASVAANQIFPVSADAYSDIDEVGDEEDELDNSKFVMSYAYSTLSFQKRQALGKTGEIGFIYYFFPELYNTCDMEMNLAIFDFRACFLQLHTLRTIEPGLHYMASFSTELRFTPYLV